LSVNGYNSLWNIFRYLLLVKTQYGDEAEMLVEEILRRGQDTASSVIIRAATRLKESLKGNTQFLMKWSYIMEVMHQSLSGLMLFVWKWVIKSLCWTLAIVLVIFKLYNNLETESALIIRCKNWKGSLVGSIRQHYSQSQGYLCRSHACYMPCQCHPLIVSILTSYCCCIILQWRKYA
jgi:hypothetical protein